MPFRTRASQRLAETLSVLDHPHRIRIVEELGRGELDVGSLSALLELSPSGTSQHLAKLRAMRFVRERRDGRRVFYRLVDPRIAQWLLAGIALLETAPDASGDIKNDLRKAREAWSQP